MQDLLINEVKIINIITEIAACDLCGGEEYKLLYSKPDYRSDSDQMFDVVQCVSCGLKYLNPQPLSAEISKLYPEVYYTVRNTKYWLKRYGRRLDYIKKLPVRSLIDIGCASGDFVRFACEYGYKADGYEELYSGDGSSDINIYSGEPELLPNKVQQYDCVTAWGVLEHLKQPSAYFSLANHLLAEEGYFVLLVTNGDSIPSRYLYDEDVPRHMTFFTPDTIKKYADKYGFEVVQIYHHNRIYQMSNMNYLHYIICKLFRRRVDQFSMPNYRQMKGLPVNSIYLLLSKVISRFATFHQMIFKKNGILTAVLRKREAI